VFKDGRRLQDTINQMRAAGSYPDTIPPIRTFPRGGLTWTLDNRRLFAAYQAGVPPNTVPATPEEIDDEIERKMTTPCEGRFIGVKGPIE
jgi:filamentous hemagglutinin